MSSNGSEKLQTCEASLTHMSPDWPSGAWEHFPETRPGNWAAGQRCLLKTCGRALQLHLTQARRGKLHADMCNLQPVELSPVELSQGEKEKGAAGDVEKP